MNEVLQKLVLVILIISLYGCGPYSPFPPRYEAPPKNETGVISGQHEAAIQPQSENWGRPFKGDIARVVYPHQYQNGPWANPWDYTREDLYEGLNKAYVGGRWKYQINIVGGIAYHEYIGGKIVLVDKSGQVVTEEPFDELRHFYEGMAAVKVKKKWGFIDKTGKYIAKPQFEEVMNFYGGWAAVKLEGKWGFIDNTGKVIISPQFDGVRYISDGLARVKVEAVWVYIDKNGNIQSR